MQRDLTLSDVHIEEEWGWRGLEICHVFDWLYCFKAIELLFPRKIGVDGGGNQIIGHFCGHRKWIAPNLTNDYVNFGIGYGSLLDPRDNLIMLIHYNLIMLTWYMIKIEPHLEENHNQFPKLTWSIVRFPPSCSNISKRCLLCLSEKLLVFTFTIQQNY